LQRGAGFPTLGNFGLIAGFLPVRSPLAGFPGPLVAGRMTAIVEAWSPNPPDRVTTGEAARMLPVDAEARLERFLSPLAVGSFLGPVLSGGFRLIRHDGRTTRGALLGPDPRTLLSGAVHLADRLTYHSANPLGAPPSLEGIGLEGIGSPADFRTRIAAFHERNYSVRFPELRPLSVDLDILARALETLICQPVTASAFWSRGGMRAPVHYDDHDLIVVQLMGTKRWYVSTTPSQLFNAWKSPSGSPPALGPHEILDLAPGDLLYLPRGTFHTVDSETESVHLAIGFTPLTLRDAILAALDHLSDMNRPLRATVAGRLQGAPLEALGPQVVDATSQLLAACRAPGFLAAALERRASRTLGDLTPLPRPTAVPRLGPDTRLRRAAGAVCHLGASGNTLDFAYPGGHLFIHRGAQDAVLHIAQVDGLRIRDLPGDITDEVRVALAARLVDVGFLEPDPGTPAVSETAAIATA
jgi:hypothetical protein